MQFSHTLTTVADASAIWTVWTDVPRWPQWDSELTGASLVGDFCLGATGQLTPKKGPVSTFVISQLAWGDSYTLTCSLPLCKLHVRRVMTHREGALCFTHEVSFKGPLAIVFGKLLGRQFQKVLPGVMVAVREIAEASK